MDFGLPLFPMIAVLIFVGVFALILIIIALSRTKTATDEARLGHYEILLLPSGHRYSGLLTLASSFVSEEHTFELARTETIRSDDAKKLQNAFGNLHFYAFRDGTSKYLLVSSENIEDVEFAKVVDEVFVFPFGWVSKRLVIGDGVEAEWGKWKVLSIEPRSLLTNLSAETFKTMTNISQAAGCIKDLSIRIKKEMPWKQIARAREKQLSDLQEKFAKSEHQKAELRLAAGKESLFVPEPTGETKTRVSITQGITFWQVLFSFIAFLTSLYLIPQQFPQQDPLILSAVVFFITLIAYPKVNKFFSKWF